MKISCHPLRPLHSLRTIWTQSVQDHAVEPEKFIGAWKAIVVKRVESRADMSDNNTAGNLKSVAVSMSLITLAIAILVEWRARYADRSGAVLG